MKTFKFGGREIDVIESKFSPPSKTETNILEIYQVAKSRLTRGYFRGRTREHYQDRVKVVFPYHCCFCAGELASCRIEPNGKIERWLHVQSRPSLYDHCGPKCARCLKEEKLKPVREYLKEIKYQGVNLEDKDAVMQRFEEDCCGVL